MLEIGGHMEVQAYLEIISHLRLPELTFPQVLGYRFCTTPGF